MGTPGRSGPRPIADALQAILREAGLGPSSREARVLEAWNRALEPSLRAKAVAVSFRQGTLTVEVGSSPLLHELRSFTGEEIKQKANAAFPHPPIRRVVFKTRSR